MDTSFSDTPTSKYPDTDTSVFRFIDGQISRYRYFSYKIHQLPNVRFGTISHRYITWQISRYGTSVVGTATAGYPGTTVIRYTNHLLYCQRDQYHVSSYEISRYQIRELLRIQVWIQQIRIRYSNWDLYAGICTCQISMYGNISYNTLVTRSTYYQISRNGYISYQTNKIPVTQI
jgi:hypothetical protein